MSGHVRRTSMVVAPPFSGHLGRSPLLKLSIWMTDDLGLAYDKLQFLRKFSDSTDDFITTLSSKGVSSKALREVSFVCKAVMLPLESHPC